MARLVVELKHLKAATNAANAKYRRRVTSPAMQAALGVRAVEWSLGTKDPAQIYAAYSKAHARFEAMEAKAEGASVDQVEWEMAHDAAVRHGLAKPGDQMIGPVDPMGEGHRFDAFTAAALAEAEMIQPTRLNVPLATNPPKTTFQLLAEAQLRGLERPAAGLHEVVEAYLQDKVRRSSYRDLEKQVWIAVHGLEEAMGRKNPPMVEITLDDAYAYRDSLMARGNAIGTIRRRITAIRAPLESAIKRRRITGWLNPFSGLEMPDDDGAAGEVKRDSLTLDDIRTMTPAMLRMNDDARDIWHLMLFTGAGPNEIRGIQWAEVDLTHEVPFFEIKGNVRRRLKTGERPRRIPLVGTALQMMRDRVARRKAGQTNVFPRYGGHPDARTLSAVLIKGMKAGGVWKKTRKVPYSARHALKDWMRRVAPQNIQLLLFGHGFKSEGGGASGYGTDELLDKQAEFLVIALDRWGVLAYPDPFTAAATLDDPPKDDDGN